MWWLRSLFLWLTLFPVGCTTIVDTTPNPTPSIAPSTNTPNLIVTIATPTFVPPTATALPFTPASTSTPPSLTPTLVPLTETGPWLIFGESKWEAGLLRPWVANVDGSGLHPLSGLASFDWEYQHEWVAVATKEELSSSHTLNIWHLPMLEPIAVIDLGGDAYRNMERAGWSPEGCYFVFNVKDDEVYGRLKLYSCVDNSISDIDTVHHTFQQFVTWSPDGRWLLYTVESDKDSVRTSPAFLFAYSPQENLHLQMPLEDLGFGYGIEWISSDEAVIVPYPYEGDSWRVDYLSLRTNTPTMTVLYHKDNFSGVVTNPLIREVLVGTYEHCPLCDGSQEMGLRILIDSGEIHPFEGEYYGGSNLPRYHTNVGIVKDDRWAFISYTNQFITTYRIAQNNTAPQASTDGSMILFPDDRNIRGSLLSTIKGEVIRILGNIEYATWLSNESEFLTLEPAGASQRLVRYRSTMEWQAEVLVPHLGKFYHLGVITPGS